MSRFAVGDRVRHLHHYEEYGVGHIDSSYGKAKLAFIVEWSNVDFPVFVYWRDLVLDDYYDFEDKIKDRIK